MEERTYLPSSDQVFLDQSMHVQNIFRMKLRHGPNEWGRLVWTCAALISPCFPEARTEITAFKTTDYFSLTLKIDTLLAAASEDDSCNYFHTPLILEKDKTPTHAPEYYFWPHTLFSLVFHASQFLLIQFLVRKFRCLFSSIYFFIWLCWVKRFFS